MPCDTPCAGSRTAVGVLQSSVVPSLEYFCQSSPDNPALEGFRNLPFGFNWTKSLIKISACKLFSPKFTVTCKQCEMAAEVQNRSVVCSSGTGGRLRNLLWWRPARSVTSSTMGAGFCLEAVI